MAVGYTHRDRNAGKRSPRPGGIEGVAQCPRPRAFNGHDIHSGSGGGGTPPPPLFRPPRYTDSETEAKQPYEYYGAAAFAAAAAHRRISKARRGVRTFDEAGAGPA